MKVDDPLAGYDVVSDKARVSTEYLIKIKEKLLGDGEINDINSPAVLAFIEALIRVWRDLFPNEFEGRLLQQRTDWEVERTVNQTNKEQGGYFTVSFPPRLYQMFRVFMPNVKWTDRENTKLLTDNFPLLKGTQYRI